MAQKPEDFAGIDFEEIKEVTSLEQDEIKVLKICFNMFDTKDQGFLSAGDLDDILRGMGFRPSKEELAGKVARWQNLIPSFPWIAPGWRAWGRNPRKGRDQILQRSVAEP